MLTTFFWIEHCLRLVAPTEENGLKCTNTENHAKCYQKIKLIITLKRAGTSVETSEKTIVTGFSVKLTFAMDSMLTPTTSLARTLSLLESWKRLSEDWLEYALTWTCQLQSSSPASLLLLQGKFSKAPAGSNTSVVVLVLLTDAVVRKSRGPSSSLTSLLSLNTRSMLRFCRAMHSEMSATNWRKNFVRLDRRRFRTQLSGLTQPAPSNAFRILETHQDTQ